MVNYEIICNRVFEQLPTLKCCTSVGSRVLAKFNSGGGNSLLDKAKTFVHSDTFYVGEKKTRDGKLLYDHSCSKEGGGFLSARCQPYWDRLSAEQRDCISEIEDKLRNDKSQGVKVTIASIQGIGGCGKTLLLTHILNHCREAIIIYLAKCNLRVLEFAENEFESDDRFAISPRVVNLVMGMTGFRQTLLYRTKGKFVCNVDKLLYNLNSFESCQWVSKVDATESNMKITLEKTNVRGETIRDIVVMLDESSMIPPPTVHKILDTLVNIGRNVHVTLIMVGDYNQLKPIGWSNVPPGDNGDYYSGDTVYEMEKRLGIECCRKQLVMNQRNSSDPMLSMIVQYLSKICDQGGAYKCALHAIFSMCLKKKIDIYDMRGLCRNIVVEGNCDFDINGDEYISNYTSYDKVSLFNYETRNDCNVSVNITRLVEIMIKMYRIEIYDGVHVVEINNLMPLLILVDNCRCNEISQAMTMELIKVVSTELRLKGDRHYAIIQIDERVAQIIMKGLVYKMSETISVDGKPVLCSGERVVVRKINFYDDPNIVKSVHVKSLDNRVTEEIVIYTGLGVKNRLNNFKNNGVAIFPLVSVLCETIFQMQGTTIHETSRCVVDLIGANVNGIYVALSRFRTCDSITSITVNEANFRI